MHNAFVVYMDFTLFIVLFFVSGSVSSRFLSSISHRKYILVSLSRYTRANKNPKNPKPEMTCGTVAIIIRVVLLSPYLRSLVVSLSSIHYNQSHRVYRVSQEERAKPREGVPYVKLYRYNPKHLCPKLNGYGDNGQRSLEI